MVIYLHWSVHGLNTFFCKIKILKQQNQSLKITNYQLILFTFIQQVCDDLLSYTVFGDNQVNIWVASDGSRPFSDAPDSQRAVVTAKLLWTSTTKMFFFRKL